MTYGQSTMPLTSDAADTVDDIDNHLSDCTCDECIANLILMMQEYRT